MEFTIVLPQGGRMTDFAKWCDPLTVQNIKDHTAGRLLSNDDGAGIDAVVATLAEKYSAAGTLVHIAEKYGKQKVADFLRKKFPTKASARSGDIGEILAGAYLHEECGYAIGPSRLIDRDHQEWAMRGDDVLGAKIDAVSGVQLAKVESKSGKKMPESTVKQARDGLERSDGLPSPQSLAQFVERLQRASEETLADAVLDLQLFNDIRPETVTHVMFLFTQADPRQSVKADLTSYTGPIKQHSLTLHVDAHPEFIKQVYQKALDNDA